MGRPLLEIDEALVEKLAAIHCTMIEIAAVAGCSVDTLEARFSEVIKRGKASGKASLRRLQWKAAEKGNVSMLIWLGKQMLGQKDRQPDEPPAAIIHNTTNFTKDQMTEIIKMARSEVK